MTPINNIERYDNYMLVTFESQVDREIQGYHRIGNKSARLNNRAYQILIPDNITYQNLVHMYNTNSSIIWYEPINTVYEYLHICYKQEINLEEAKILYVKLLEEHIKNFTCITDDVYISLFGKPNSHQEWASSFNVKQKIKKVLNNYNKINV